MLPEWRRACRDARRIVSKPYLLASWAALVALCAGSIGSQTTLTAESAKAIAGEIAFDARAEHVVDGDTIDVRRSDGIVLRIRVHGIDCPERGQPFAKVARNFTRAMVIGQDVRVLVRDTDRYGRLVAQIRVGTRDLGHLLVEAGLAWQFHRYSDDPRLASLESAARAARRGVWQLDVDSRLPVDTRRLPHPPLPRPGSGASEVRGNVKSRLYHRASCTNYTCRSCTRVFPGEKEAKASGFRPAKDCNF